MDLRGLVNLNLAGNHLTGRIPDKIGKLKQLQVLDLSRNDLCGPIPQSLSDLNFLSSLNLSFNHLTGRIPAGNQLQTLTDPSINAGNNQLCGQPVMKPCAGDTESHNIHHYNQADSDSDDERMWFYAGIGPGLLVGFLGFCSSLHFIKPWRDVSLQAVSGGEDRKEITLNEADIWVQVYDIPKGLVSENILQGIANYVGIFVKSDPTNFNGLWKAYYRIRVRIDVWHSERDCNMVYANPGKELERTYGTWLRAPNKNIKNEVASRWLRNAEGKGNWGGSGGNSGTAAAGSGKEKDEAQIKENGHGGGLALLWKNVGALEIRGTYSNYIDFEVNYEQIGSWRYTGFYGCPERERCQESWNLFTDLATGSSLPWCVFGDFNDMLFEFKKKGGRPQPRRLLEGFNKTIIECGLEDLGFKGCKFTWERFRGTERGIMIRFRSRRDAYGVRKYNETREEFLKLLERQEVYWKQRSKQFWLHEGDQNTHFFTSLPQVKRITSEQNTQLLEDISAEEVKEAVFSMHAKKAPGYDGLNPAFYQAYWSIVEQDVVEFCQRFFATGELQMEFNRTLVCLIPKVKQPQQMKGRLLTDNALIAFEINHYIKRRSQGRNGVAGLKIDISKAYADLSGISLKGVVYGDVRPQRGIRQGDPIERNMS
ncbi:hypothetical protein AgCh_030606 [Apium graveolens]